MVLLSLPNNGVLAPKKLIDLPVHSVKVGTLATICLVSFNERCCLWLHTTKQLDTVAK